MSEIAEDIQDGFMCSHCGVCFEEEHGHPVLCDSCYKEQKKDIQKAKQGKYWINKIPKHIHKEL